MKPRKPLKRGAPPQRKKTLSKSGKRLVRKALARGRGKPRFKNGKDPVYLQWIRGMRCEVGLRDKPCSGRVEAAHLISRGAGGADYGNVLPLCTRHHQRQHAMGIQSFAAYYFGTYEALERVVRQSYPWQYEAHKKFGWTPDFESPE